MENLLKMEFIIPIKSEIYISLIDVQSDEIKNHGAIGAVMHVTAWANDEDSFLERVSYWLGQYDYTVIKNEKIMKLNEFRKSDSFFGLEILNNLMSDIGDKKFDVWFGDVHMYMD